MKKYPQLIIALDVPEAKLAIESANLFQGLDVWMKVGLELFTAAGPEVVHTLVNAGFPVFLDMKFHDIPNTVAGAVASSVRTGASMLTLHIEGGQTMAKAALDARHKECIALGLIKPPLLLGITVLTSISPEQTMGQGMQELVTERALAAKEYGLDGIVCSGHEVKAVKKACGDKFICLCPGIRMTENLEQQKNDQARVSTPKQAAENGADFIVVGRPIMRAANPLAAAQSIMAFV